MGSYSLLHKVVNSLSLRVSFSVNFLKVLFLSYLLFLLRSKCDFFLESINVPESIICVYLGNNFKASISLSFFRPLSRDVFRSLKIFVLIFCTCVFSFSSLIQPIVWTFKNARTSFLPIKFQISCKGWIPFPCFLWPICCFCYCVNKEYFRLVLFCPSTVANWFSPSHS